MIPPALEISYDRNSFPTPLEDEADWRKHIRKGHVRRTTRVTLSRNGGPSQYMRAEEVPELLAIFEEFDPSPPAPAPAPPKPRPAPRTRRPAPPAPAAPAEGGDRWEALQDYIELVARRGSRPSDFAALISRFDRPSAVRLDAAGELVLEPFDPADPNQPLVALGDGARAAVVPTYDYVANFDLAFSEPAQNSPAVHELFDLEPGDDGLRIDRLAVIGLSGGAARLEKRGRLGGFRTGAPLSTGKVQAPPGPPAPSPPPPARAAASPPAANPFLPWLLIGGPLVLLLVILLLAQTRIPPSGVSEVRPPPPTYSPDDSPEMNAQGPLPEAAPLPTYPTSFDCAVAALPSERMICETQDIAAQDVEMARLHGELLTGLPPNERGRTVDEQTAWRRERDDCAAQSDPVACLRRIYAARIGQLRAAVLALEGTRAAETQDTPPAAAPASTPPATGRGTPPQPIGHFPSWITTADYPEWARRSGESGVTAYSLSVDAAGRIAGCEIISSSGSSALDQLTCQLFRQRGRFLPARDASGNPVAGWIRGNATWGPAGDK